MAKVIATTNQLTTTQKEFKAAVPEGHQAFFGSFLLFLDGSKTWFTGEDLIAKGVPAMKVAREVARRIKDQQDEFDRYAANGQKVIVTITMGTKYVPNADDESPGQWVPNTLSGPIEWNSRERRDGLMVRLFLERQPVETHLVAANAAKGSKGKSTRGFAGLSLANSGANTGS